MTGNCAIPPEASADDRRQEDAGTRRKSVSTYRQALLEDPKDVATRHELALILHSASDHFAALRELDYCLGLRPDDPDMLCSRGLVNVSVGDFETAEGDLHRAAELGGESAEAELYLGVLLSRRGLWRHAIPHFRRSIELEGQQAAAYLYLGEALNCIDDLSGALSAFDRAHDLDPGSERALRGLGIVYDRLGRSADAVEMYHRSRRVAAQRKTGRGIAPPPVTLPRRSTACTCPWRSETPHYEE